MVKFKFQCKCGFILEGKTENIMGGSNTDSSIHCNKCQRIYRIQIQVKEIK